MCVSTQNQATPGVLDYLLKVIQQSTKKIKAKKSINWTNERYIIPYETSLDHKKKKKGRVLRWLITSEQASTPAMYHLHTCPKLLRVAPRSVHVWSNNLNAMQNT